MDLRFDRYPDFSELSQSLRALASAHPDLCTLETIGSSREGRELWLATVTNAATGPHDSKPAVWLDGNIHASELAASVASTHLVAHLVSRYGEDERVTRAVDTRTFYVVPRVNPDGAELALAERPFVVRSTTRPWPRSEQQPGWVPADVDADGRLLQLRIPDPAGTWKPFPDDPRLLVAREPDEEGGGPYFRLLREGRLHGRTNPEDLSLAPPLAGVDANRNFPFEWRRYPEGSFAPTGAGDFPTSEPEVRAVVEAVVARPNIVAYLAYHTYSGVHLRPYSDRPDHAMPTQDLRIYEELGRQATAITGYPSIGVYEKFRYDPKDVITGVADDWAYDQRGLLAWTTELWSPLAAAGIVDADPLDWYRSHDLDEELQLYTWTLDNVVDGYVDWYPFDHPDLGPVELGGWNAPAVFRNPPPNLLEAEVAPHSDLAVHLALVSPQLVWREATAEALGERTWRVRAAVANAGWLPTNVTEQAEKRRVVDPLEARIELGDHASLVSGELNHSLGQLAGRALRTSSIGLFGSPHDGSAHLAHAEWILRADAGGTVAVTFTHPRAGTLRTELTLDGKVQGPDAVRS